ncbi:MAG: carbohydrate binding domain-containing protein, partial [Phycisphaeraceae bacterium]|nr:carbohydrate binding domain-containing protein [Phycisphaeraceae bacterium]
MCYRTTLWVSFGMMCLVFMVQAASAQVENLTYNPSMEEDESLTDMPGWGMWYLRAGMGSEAAFDESESIDGARSLRIDPIGTADLHVNVGNQIIPLEVGTRYTVSFWAKAEEEKTMVVEWSSNDNVYFAVDWGYTQFDLTTEWAEYAFTSEAQYAQSKSKLNFLCGSNEATMWLDFVWVYEGE